MCALAAAPGHILKRRRVRTAQDAAQGPQGAAVAVVRAALFEPIALVIHKITKAFRPYIEGIPGERQVASRQFRGVLVSQFLQEHTDHQGAGVIVRCIPFAIVGDRENGMLQNAGLIGEVMQVVQFERG